MALTREDILGLRQGEVVRLGNMYLVVEEIDLQQTNVRCFPIDVAIPNGALRASGLLRNPNKNRVYGSCEYSVEALMNSGDDIAKWRSPA